MKGVVVVRPGWVFESCKEGRKLPCEPHALPPFDGLRITATGLSLGEVFEFRAPLLPLLLLLLLLLCFLWSIFFFLPGTAVWKELSAGMIWIHDLGESLRVG